MGAELSLMGRFFGMVSRRLMLLSPFTIGIPGNTRSTAPMNHLVLLGDSTLDNKAYVPPGRDVTALLKRALPQSWTVSLLAFDGAVIADVEKQVRSLPGDATQLLISVGGNDGLRDANLLGQPVSTIAEALAQLDKLRGRFEDNYRRMLERVGRYGLGVAICSIYRPRFDDPALQLASRAALPLLNDIITGEAFARGLDLLDLRLLFDHPDDFSNTIEPSAQGGLKMAKAIAGMLVGEQEVMKRSQVVVR
jgi:hypothetical protein